MMVINNILYHLETDMKVGAIKIFDFSAVNF